MAEAADATAPVAFAVLRYVRTAQAHYGLKHADYTRYRCACDVAGLLICKVVATQR